MQYFLDASFLIALFNEEDDFHQDSKRIIKDLMQRPYYFLTSNIVLAETVNLIFRVKGIKESKRLLKGFRESDIEEVYLTPEIFTQGYKILFKQKSKRGLNLFDCFHLAAMKYLGVSTILTYDERFKKEVKVIN